MKKFKSAVSVFTLIACLSSTIQSSNALNKVVQNEKAKRSEIYTNELNELNKIAQNAEEEHFEIYTNELNINDDYGDYSAGIAKQFNQFLFQSIQHDQPAITEKILTCRPLYRLQAVDERTDPSLNIWTVAMIYKRHAALSSINKALNNLNNEKLSHLNSNKRYWLPQEPILETMLELWDDQVILLEIVRLRTKLQTSEASISEEAQKTCLFFTMLLAGTLPPYPWTERTLSTFKDSTRKDLSKQALLHNVRLPRIVYLPPDPKIIEEKVWPAITKAHEQYQHLINLQNQETEQRSKIIFNTEEIRSKIEAEFFQIRVEDVASRLIDAGTTEIKISEQCMNNTESRTHEEQIKKLIKIVVPTAAVLGSLMFLTKMARKAK